MPGNRDTRSARRASRESDGLDEAGSGVALEDSDNPGLIPRHLWCRPPPRKFKCVVCQTVSRLKVGAPLSELLEDVAEGFQSRDVGAGLFCLTQGFQEQAFEFQCPALLKINQG